MIGRAVRVLGTYAAVAVISLPGGCTRPLPAPIVSPYPQPRSLVVMPLMNHSGSSDFDDLRATDLLVEELSQVDGLVVLPANRPLKLLLGRGQTHATSVEQATEIAAQLGADGVLVGAVTAYDPYTPPTVGMILQLYWVRADMKFQATDPVGLSRAATGGDRAYYVGPGPASQAQAVLDAGKNDVAWRVNQYARTREGQDSPYGWRRYLVDSEAYFRFACHDLIGRLMSEELRRITVPVAVEPHRP